MKLMIQKMINIIALSLLLFLVAEIFYLSWLPNGRLGKETYLPLWILSWSNTYFNIRTAIPFIILSFMFEAWHTIKTPSVREKKVPFWTINMAISTIIVCLAEGGQFFILNRHPDFMDVIFGILGSILGCFLYYLLNIFKQLIIIKKKKQT
jgi:glycopeptide antibiotics resistance protein